MGRSKRSLVGLLAVGALALMDQRPQLIAHARGAMHFGATQADLEEVLFTVTLDEDHARETVQQLTQRS